ncbi:MAG: hypothetical protein NTW11_01670 [Candidatus Staskawiczbacteria bacterium]|nr:hypothetical protein [Candidatus Staskawiczbacteria bacterium]
MIKPDQLQQSAGQEQLPPSRNVAIDEKHLGMEIDEISLGDQNPYKSTFGEVYFRTASGNIYLIKKMGTGDEAKDIMEGKNWAVINGKDNAGKGKKIEGSFLTEQDVSSGLLKVGTPYTWSGGNSSEVSEIVIVDGQTVRDNLNELTEGRTNTITKDFAKIVQAPKK